MPTPVIINGYLLELSGEWGKIEDMSFSEDPSSPAAPFSGDSTGKIFDLPDMVANSPETSERVVDTQSGFLVVLKKFGDRIALSVKRRAGTPPSSSVQLTPDECVRLSRILSSSFSTADDLAAELSARTKRKRSASKLFGHDDSEDVEEKSEADLVVPGQSLSSVHVPMKLMLASVLRAFMVPILGVALSVFALGIGAGVSGIKLFEKDKTPSMVALSDPLEKSKVDKFVRSFVGQMLDFSATSYRASQVHAMSSMGPDLLERYWQETKFPLSKKQLAALPQGSTVQIAELQQERVDANTVSVEVKAILGNPADPQASTPVNLRLKLGVDADKNIVVTYQQDTSSK